MAEARMHTSGEDVPLPANAEKCKCRFANVTKDNIGQLRRMNFDLFPVRYNDKFYGDILAKADTQLIRLAYHSDFLVGSVCCRLENYKTVEPTETESKSKRKEKKKDKEEDAEKPMKRLYIMTLGVLNAYRRYGIGTRLLNHVIQYARESDKVDEIFLHVQVSNTVALKFYERFGFKVVSTIKNYYKRIEPSDCFLVTRRFDKETKPAEAPVQA